MGKDCDYAPNSRRFYKEHPYQQGVIAKIKLEKVLSGSSRDASSFEKWTFLFVCPKDGNRILY